MTVVACKKNIRLPTDTAIEVEVDLNQYLPDNTYFLRARFIVRLPGVNRKLALSIVNEATRYVRTLKRHAAISPWRSILFERIGSNQRPKGYASWPPNLDAPLRMRTHRRDRAVWLVPPASHRTCPINPTVGEIRI